jgi:hypothetical protein
MMSESTFSKKLRTSWNLLGVKTDRVESHSTCPGMPDIWCRCQEIGFWVETKENNDDKRIHYEPNQALWQEIECEHRGNAFTILHHPPTRKVYLIWGIFARTAEKDLEKAHAVIFSITPGWEKAILDEIKLYGEH